MTYTFTPDDKRQVLALARSRNDHKVRAGTASNKYDDSKSELEAHYHGALGEYAAAKLLGLRLDRAQRRGGDDGRDLVLPNGLTVEVRYRTRRGYDFALGGPSLSHLRADLGLLVWPGAEEDTVELVGFTSRVHMACRGEVMDFGYGERLVVKSEDLLPMQRFEALAQQNDS